ncbi:MAG: DNA-processing protein DprA [Actinomycetota bacterium]|nr:DNA-processing protein DprA [Actinomycetota bacterium]
MPDEVAPRGFPDGFGRGERERRALLALASLRGITPRRLHEQAWRVGSAEACLAGIKAGRTGSEGDREAARETVPDEVSTAVAAAGARFVTPCDEEYPAALFDLERDPPIALFVKGQALNEPLHAVSIVGARNCSALGNEVAYDIGAGLGGAGVCVVSGAARGIDAASHRGALAAGGSTIAVLGSGIDVAYPKGSRELIERTAASGSVVSEYAPGVKAEPFRFPARNRIVAALGQALVVVEGAKGSGSMISVDHALELGREVFAVPGPVTSPLSEVPLELIRDGATMIRGADDLLHDLGLAQRLAVSAPPHLPEDERRAYAALAGPSLPDTVARAANLSIPEAVTALIRLELRGLVRSVGGRYERRLGAVETPGEPA